MIAEFALRIQQKTFVPAFMHFSSPQNKSELIASVHSRLACPHLINQVGASLCGPASYFYCLLQDAPDVYVKLVEQLYCEGRAQHQDLRIQPSRNCLRLVNLNGMALVDWITLGALRDSSNFCFSFTRPVNTFKGITWPTELVRWFQKTGYNKVENRARLWPHHSLAHLQSIECESGLAGHYCLFVGVQAIGQTFQINNIANHWVVLSQCLQSAPKINVYTWGQPLVDFNGGRNSLAAFCPYYFGYVRAINFLD